MKKIWICGACGMLGSHFKRLIAEKRIPFVASDKKGLDITDLESVSDFMRVQKITHVINCAAYTQVDQAESEPKRAYMVNAIGPHNLGVAGRRHGARVLHFSTDYVFDGNGRMPYSEEHTCSPLNAYGMSKFAGEIKLLDEHQQACIIRTSWLFGFPGRNFVETMLSLMSEKDQLKVVVDQIGRPTYCQDLAAVALEMLHEKGVFHFANAMETSWYQFAKEIHKQASEMGYPILTKQIEPIATKDYPTAAPRPSYTTLNTKKIETILGRPPRTWQEALTDYLVQVKRTQKRCSAANENQ